MDEAIPRNNTGLVKRRQYFAESLDIVLIGFPHADVFHIDKLISPGNDVSVKFMPKNDKFWIISSYGDNLGPKVVIDNMNLIICTKKLSYAAKLTY